MTRIFRVFVSVLIVSAWLIPATALAENTVVGTWEIDFQAMRDALGEEYVAGADETITDNEVTMVLNADNTGTRTQTLAGNTEVVNATWSVSNIQGNNCDVTITESGGGSTTTWTFVDADTINWDEPGLPTPVVMRRIAP